MAGAGVREQLGPHIPFELSPEEWAEVEAGNDLYLLGPGDGIRDGLAVAVLESPPERVYEVVTDNDRFAEFMPYVAVSFLERSDDSLINYQCLDLPLVSDRYYRVRITNVEPSAEDPAWRSSWTFVEGNVNGSEGSWVLLPAAEGGTRVVYRVRSDPGGAWNFIKNLATKKGLEPLIQSVRQRAADPSYVKDGGRIPRVCESPPG